MRRNSTHSRRVSVTDAHGRERYQVGNIKEHRRRLSTVRPDQGLNFRNTVDGKFDIELEQFTKSALLLQEVKVNLQSYMEAAKTLSNAGVILADSLGKLVGMPNVSQPSTNALLEVLSESELKERKEKLTEELQWYKEAEEFELCFAVKTEIETITKMLDAGVTPVSDAKDTDEVSVKNDRICQRVASKYKDNALRLRRFFDFSALNESFKILEKVSDEISELQDDVKERQDIVVEVDHYSLKVEQLMKDKASESKMARNRDKQGVARHQYNDVNTRTSSKLTTFNRRTRELSLPILQNVISTQSLALTRCQAISTRLTSDDLNSLQQVTKYKEEEKYKPENLDSNVLVKNKRPSMMGAPPTLTEAQETAEPNETEEERAAREAEEKKAEQAEKAEHNRRLSLMKAPPSLKVGGPAPAVTPVPTEVKEAPATTMASLEDMIADSGGKMVAPDVQRQESLQEEQREHVPVTRGEGEIVNDDIVIG